MRTTYAPPRAGSARMRSPAAGPPSPREASFERAFPSRVGAVPAALETLGLGVVLFSRRGEILSINAAAADLLDVPLDGTAPTAVRLLGRLGVEWPDGRRVAFRETPFARARQGETVREAVVSFAPAAQPRRWLQVGAAPLRGTGSGIQGVVMNVVDATRAHEAERERRAALDGLMGELAPSIERIVEGAARLQASAGDDGSAAGARAILRAARRIASGLRELDTALRFDAGAIVPAPELVDVKAFLLDLLEHAPPEIDPSRIIASAQQGLPRAYVDPDHLERIVVELVRGALAGAPPGSDIAVLCEGSEGRLHVTVAASGQDIAAEDLPRLFEPFFRARGRPVGRLHAVRSLVEANRGRIAAESGAGRGLAIRVSLPVRPSERADGADPGARGGRAP